MFNKKYEEFCADLQGACPELKDAIDAAVLIAPIERAQKFAQAVLPTCTPTRNPKANPGTVLPGVVISDSVWAELSDNSKKAIQE